MLPILASAEPPGHLGLFLSVALLLITVGGLVVAWLEAVVRGVGERRLAKGAAAAGLAAGAPLAVGRAVIFGAVELASDEALAMRVEIDQAGTEKEASGSYSFAWTETERRVEMRPFYVVHSSGARVRVEPGAHAFLVDAMDGIIVVDSARRTRVAELSAGEQVYVVGRLERARDPGLVPTGYRDAEPGWLMRTRRGEDLLLSSEPLEARYRRREWAQYRVALGAVLLGVAALALFSPYLARNVLAHNMSAVVEARRSSSDDDGTSYYLVVRARGGPPVEVRASPAVYDVAEPGTVVPVRYVEAWPWASTLGRRATLDAGACFGLGLLGVMLAIRHFVRKRAARWYEAKLVDTGSGRLAAHPRSTSM